MSTFSFGVSVFLKDKQHPLFTEKTYEYIKGEDAEIKIVRKQTKEI